MTLDPKTAARLCARLFPDDPLDVALFKLLEWYDEYTAGRSPVEKEPSTPAIEPVSPQPDIKAMMRDIFTHAKQNNIPAVELARLLSVSYPSVLNWQRGKQPKGKNIAKVEAYYKTIHT